MSHVFILSQNKEKKVIKRLWDRGKIKKKLGKMEKESQINENDVKKTDRKKMSIGEANLLIGLGALLLLLIVFVATNVEPPQTIKQNNLAKQDSITTVEQIDVDKLLEEERVKRDSIIIEIKKTFTFKLDEFENRHWIKPKNRPKYTDMNGCYCYFQMNQDSTVSNFRFRFQYFANDWLFIKKMIFNVDGEENLTILPSMEKDCGYGGIWEWCDVSVASDDDYRNSNYVTEYFIKTLSNAKSIKVKLIGDQYHNVKTLSAQQIKSIKEAYNYYKELGGKF